MTADAGKVNGGGDLRGKSPSAGWLVSGWFTPDYRPLAERLAGQLERIGAPYHLLSVEKTGEWDKEVFRKPLMVQRAMAAHATEVIVFMDVDCQVVGPIAEAVAGSADLSCYLAVKKRGRRQFGDLSSRVLVVRPTAGGHAMIEAWAEACREETEAITDEPPLMVALGRTHGATWSTLDHRFAGREMSSAPGGASVVHDSAHEQSTLLRRLNRRLKSLRRSLLGTGAGRSPAR